MTPGQAPVRMDGKTFDELTGELISDPEVLWVPFCFYGVADHIEPIENEE